MKYFELILSCERKNLETLEFHLGDFSNNGWDISDALTRKDILDPALLWATTILDEKLFLQEKERVRVKIYFNTEEEAKEAQRALLQTGLCMFLSLKELEDTDYANAWKKYYHPFSVGEFLIVPAWEKVPVTEKKVLRMDPGMAFGSGTHESTMLCLKALQEITPRGFVYDVGCGSGILGLAALLSGAQRVEALDIDPLAIEAVLGNAKLNGCANRISASLGDLLKGQERQADLIFGNLIAEVVVELVPQTLNCLKEGGYFITSGILKEKEDMVKEVLYANAFEILKIFHEKEWVGILSQRRNHV